MIIHNEPDSWIRRDGLTRKPVGIKNFTVSINRNIHLDRSGAPIPGTKELKFTWYTDDSLDPHEIILVGQEEINRYFDYQSKGHKKEKERASKKDRQKSHK